MEGHQVVQTDETNRGSMERLNADRRLITPGDTGEAPVVAFYLGGEQMPGKISRRVFWSRTSCRGTSRS